MNCKQVKELAGAYIYGDLAPEEMRDIRIHAQNCAACREDLVTRGQVISSIGDVVPELTDEEKQRIMWSVKGAVSTRNTVQRTFILRLAPALGLAAVLLLGFGIGKLACMHSFSQKPDSSLVSKVGTDDSSKPRVSVREISPSKKDQNQDIDPGDNDIADPNVFGFIGNIYRPSYTDRNNENTRVNTPGTSTEPPAAVKEDRKDNTRQIPDKNHVDKENQQSPTKDSAVTSKKSESGTESGETALPKPTDLNNAETAPGTSE